MPYAHQDKNFLAKACILVNHTKRADRLLSPESEVPQYFVLQYQAWLSDAES